MSSILHTVLHNLLEYSCSESEKGRLHDARVLPVGLLPLWPPFALVFCLSGPALFRPFLLSLPPTRASSSFAPSSPAHSAGSRSFSTAPPCHPAAMPASVPFSLLPRG
eukprot:5671363-Pleurochrysis_carterae.AAC.2